MIKRRCPFYFVVLYCVYKFPNKCLYSFFSYGS
nr:hypothetical protein LBZUJACN_LBZUJACN_CDS_0055 [Caudoviricetes sp.]CAI9751090.1 hypothetical protein MIHLRAQX_MIHLRAQX_CDS_0055 [Caudoviricetes sp.]